MSIRNLKEVNAYREFRTAAGIDRVRTAILTNALPGGMNVTQQQNFTQKFFNGDFVVVAIPLAQQGIAGHPATRLKYQPVPGIDLLVAYPDERTTFMGRIWNDRRRGYGLGLQAFFLQIAMSHLNIQKKYTDTFLRSQGDYQIQKTPQRKKVIRPVSSKASNERWGIDLIDMSFGPVGHGRTERFIFTCVDNFSGYVWARRITSRTGQVIVNTLNNIVNTAPPYGAGGTKPRILQCDNGPEFNNAQLRGYCDIPGQQIQLILSTSYHPKSNGKVERMNREIRKKLKAGFIRQNNHVWTAAILQDYVTNINSQPNQRSKLAAKDLWVPGYNPPNAIVGPVNAPALDNNNTIADLNLINRKYEHERVISLTRGIMPTFIVGDLVRVNMFALSREYRKKYKDHQGINKIMVHWSPVISRIIQVYPITARRHRQMYSITVGTPNGQPPPAGQTALLMRGRSPWLFAGTEITLSGNRTSIAPRNIPRADFMNSRS
jgi:transposase InsO family protein